VAWNDRGWRSWVQSVTPGVSWWAPNAITHDHSFALDGMDVWSRRRVVEWPMSVTWGWAYVMGRVRKATIEVHLAHRVVVIGQVRAQSRLRLRTASRRVDAVDTISAEGILVQGAIGLTEHRGTIAEIEHLAARQIARRALLVIKAADAAGVDPFGWHRELRWTESSAGRDAGTKWAGWHVHVKVRFRVRSEGVLR
jgi:hypothetical protein